MAAGLENSAAAIGAWSTSQSCSTFSARSIVGQIGHRVSSRSRLIALTLCVSSMQARITGCPFHRAFAPNHRPCRAAPRPPPGCCCATSGRPSSRPQRRCAATCANSCPIPRVVEIPRAVWLPLLYGVVLPLRPAKSAAKYASIWTQRRLAAEGVDRTPGQAAARLAGRSRAPGDGALRDALRAPVHCRAARCAQGRGRRAHPGAVRLPAVLGHHHRQRAGRGRRLGGADAPRARTALRDTLLRRCRLHRGAGGAHRRLLARARQAGPLRHELPWRARTCRQARRSLPGRVPADGQAAGAAGWGWPRARTP